MTVDREAPEFCVAAAGWGFEGMQWPTLVCFRCRACLETGFADGLLFFFLQADQLTEEQIAGKNYFTAVCGIVYQWMSPHPFVLLNELLEVRKVITASSTPPEVKQNNKEKGYAVEVVTF